MRRRRWSHCEGLTLLELTIAIALFAIVMGATAQALVTYYVHLHTQQQRSAAMAQCTSIISRMREFRDNSPGQFPASVVQEWPDGTEIAADEILPSGVIEIDYRDTTANPLEVVVTCRWQDLRNRPVRVTMATVLTDE